MAMTAQAPPAVADSRAELREEAAGEATAAAEAAAAAAATAAVGPSLATLQIEPVSAEDYFKQFAEGDLDLQYRSVCVRCPKAFRGSWQLMLQRSHDVGPLLQALGVGLLKRKVMSSFASVTDIEVLDEHPQKPTLKLTTHLPFKNTKQITITFDNQPSEQNCTDTGNWESRGVFMHGRAVQRRCGPKGVMWDTRCIFAEDPCDEDRQEGPVMLFQWTFHPVGKEPIKCLRWLKKL